MGIIRNSLFIILLAALIGCQSPGGESDDGGLPDSTKQAEYIVLAWNDLGMHCLNPTYDQSVILPPYNTVWAQVIKRGAPPQVVTAGLTVSYSLTGNTYSSGKSDSYGAIFAQFWDNASLSLFGAAGLAPDTGLNLKTPADHKGLSGGMAIYGDHFEAVGVPVVPVSDTGVWNPYQTMEITVKDASDVVLAATRATVPTSDEINCAKCHAAPALQTILETHDTLEGSTLASTAPHLCAECHGSPALGTSGAGSSGKYLSGAIHGYHVTKGAACYDCHPGTTTKCTRSLAHTTADGNCVSCHGDLANVANTIVSGRVPWAGEPKCGDCHKSSSAATLTTVNSATVSSIAEVDTAADLYRDAAGHGGVYCAACHGSPHAMVPSRETGDNYQAVTLQGKAASIGSCAVCHDDSRGEGSGEFLEEHGGTSNPSACGVCHTSFPTAGTASWPHQFQWKAR